MVVLGRSQLPTRPRIWWPSTAKGVERDVDQLAISI